MALSATDDVLLLVFERLVGPEIEEWPDARFKPSRAMAPFVLAAVCTRWRSLTRNTPAMWSYFGFPSNAKQFALHSSRLQILMELSQDAPIDVVAVLDWHYNVAVQCHPILEAIASTAERWRNARLALSSYLVTQPFVAALRVPKAPNLISLSLEIEGEPLYLPLAPRLERLHVKWQFDWENEGPFTPTSDLETLTAGMPDLRAISVMCSQDSITPTNFFGQFGDQLTYLCIMDTMWTPPPTVMRFPRVESLILRDAEYLAYLEVPNLRHLATNAMCFYNSEELALNAPTTTELTLWGQIDPHTVDELRLFQHVQTLRFCVPPPVGMWFDHTGTHNYAIYDDFFSTISQDDEIWPELTRLYLEAPQGLASFHTADLLIFVEKRNGINPANGSRGIARLVEVEIDESVRGFTDELEEQLAELVSYD